MGEELREIVEKIYRVYLEMEEDGFDEEKFKTYMKLRITKMVEHIIDEI